MSIIIDREYFLSIFFELYSDHGRFRIYWVIDELFDALVKTWYDLLGAYLIGYFLL